MASVDSQGTQSPLEAQIVAPETPEPPETPLQDPETPAIVDAEYEEVLNEHPEQISEATGIEEITPREPQDPVELVAYCPHCGKGVKSMDWGKIASWFGEHCQLVHPEIFARLFAVASAFLGLMIADMYDTEPNWNDQPSMDTMREEIVEILEGERDPLEDGIS